MQGFLFFSNRQLLDVPSCLKGWNPGLQQNWPSHMQPPEDRGPPCHHQNSLKDQVLLINWRRVTCTADQLGTWAPNLNLYDAFPKIAPGARKWRHGHMTSCSAGYNKHSLSSSTREISDWISAHWTREFRGFYSNSSHQFWSGSVSQLSLHGTIIHFHFNCDWKKKSHKTVLAFYNYLFQQW